MKEGLRQTPGEAKDPEKSGWAMRVSGEARRGGGVCHHGALREAGGSPET